MRNSVLKHFMIIGSGTFLNMLLGMLSTPIITRIVDTKEYGQLSVFKLYSSIAVMILGMGMDQAFVRFYYDKKDDDYKRSLLRCCIKIPLVAVFICSIAVIISSYNKWIEYEFSTFIIIFLCVYSIIELINRFSMLIVRLEYKTKLYSALNIANRIVYLVVVIPLLFIFKESHFEVLIVVMTFSLLVCMVAGIYAQSDIWKFRGKSDSANNLDMLPIFKYAMPYVISLGIATLFQAIDTIALNYYGSYSQVGVYSSAMTIIQVFTIVQTSFNLLWQPMSVEHYTNNPNDKTFYQKGNSIITVVMFFVGMTLILFKDIFVVLLGEEYRGAATILPFLIFNPIMYTISETTVSGLIFMKKSKMQIVIAVGACAVNIVGNSILVPLLGCEGAAISTGISYIVFFSLRTVFSNKYFYVDYKLGKFYILTLAVICYASYNTFFKFDIWSVLGYVICIVLMYIMYSKTIIWCFKYLLSIIKNKKQL